LSPNSEKCHPQITVVYQQKSPILAMQLANITPSLETKTESIRLLILDSNHKYSILTQKTTESGLTM
jgi:hypothetical protein